MKREMKNKAQMQISFGMIFSIILIIVFLAFAFFGIIKFVEIQNNVLINKFVDNLNNDIDKMWKSSRGSQEVTYDIPKKIKEVCFKDYEKENVYFVSDKNFEGGILNHVNFDETLSNKKELCIATQDKKITFVIDKFYEESLVTISKDGRNKVSNENNGNLVGGVGKVNTDCEGNPGELLIINEIYDYTDSLHGFKFWDIDDVEDSPESWTKPYDYFNGEIYTRFEVISQPTDRTSKPQFGIWQLNKQGQCKREIMSKQAVLNGEGSVATIHSSPNTWWDASTSSNHDSDAPVDFSTPNRFCRLGAPFWSDNSRLVSDWLDKNDWDLRDEYFPMRIKTTVVAVPAGGEFSGWDCWMSGGDSNEGKMNIDLQSSTFAVIGDSMSDDIVVPATMGDWPGYLITKLGLSKSDFQLNAHSGDTCSKVYNQLVNQVTDGTDFLFSTCGINGFTDNTNNIQWYQKIYDTAKEKGISKIYMTTMPPANTINEQTAAQAYCDNMKEQNNWLKNFDQEHEDLEVVDLWSMWHDSSGTGKTDCGWRTDIIFNGDKVHPNAKGSEVWAEEYYKLLQRESKSSVINFENYGSEEPTIYWEQDFEDDTLGNYLESEFREDWNNAGGRRSTEVIRIEQESGNKFMKNYFYADALNGEKGFSLAAGGIDWYMNIPGEKQEELYVSYKMKFSGNMATEYESGGKYPLHWLSGKAGLGFYTKGSGWSGAGYKPKPENKAFFVLIMFDGGYPRDSSSPNKVQQKFYEYDLDMNCPAPEPNCWGNSHKIDYYFSPDTWYTVTVRIKLDTPGANNGILQYYVNGDLITTYNNFNFRDYSDVKINMVNMANFLGGSGTAPYEDGWWAFDDFVIFNYN